MKDYEGPAYKGKGPRSNLEKKVPGSKQFNFQPAYREASKDSRAKGTTFSTQSFRERQQNNHNGNESIDSPYQVPFLKEKGKEPKDFGKEVTDTSNPEGDVKTPSAKSQYHPSIKKETLLDREFISGTKSLDPEEPKAYHRTSRSHYEPSLKIHEYGQDFQDTEEKEAGYEEVSSSEVDDAQGVTDTNQISEARDNLDASKSNQANLNHLKRVDENLRELSKRLTKSKDSFLLFDQGKGN